MALSPHKFPELQKPDLLHLDARVGLDPPKQIRTSPWSKAMAFGGVPHEADAVLHGQIITTKETKVHKGGARVSPSVMPVNDRIQTLPENPSA